jgi:hypothetical protein
MTLAQSNKEKPSECRAETDQIGAARENPAKEIKRLAREGETLLERVARMHLEAVARARRP